MQAEETKVPGPGAGLCPGYTISRAILGDAVALTRGDRFLTTDFTPYNLTAWGFQDCARDTTNGAFGGALSKILFRTLPHHYDYNSVIGLFPFYTPKRMQTILQDLSVKRGNELYKRYNYELPHRHPDLVSVDSWQAVDKVLKDHKTFKNTYEEHMGQLTNGHGYLLAYDEEAKHDADLQLIREALFPDNEAMQRLARFYREKTTELINRKSFALIGKNTRSINIVRDVINLVPVHWVSTQIAGIPLKTLETPGGLHTEQEIYQYLAVVFTYIFLNVEPASGWILRESAEKVAETFQRQIRGHLDSFTTKKKSGLLSRGLTFNKKLKDLAVHKFTDQSEDSHAFLKRLAESGKSSEELSYLVFGTIVASGANFAHAAGLVVNFYLDDARAAEREDIINLVKLTTPESDARLAGYVREAMRLDPQAPGIFRDVTADTEIIEKDGLPGKKVVSGQRLFVSLAHANMDPIAFPDPKKIDPTRPRDKYMTFGSGMHTCLGNHFTEAMIPQLLRSIFSLKNLRRGPGISGYLNRFKQDVHGTEQYLYVNAKGQAGPWPASMVLLYDVDVPERPSGSNE
ncbi:hypothetical protein FRC02_009696 [Tulasnella sp. 418]|nr:hypothetical protein FRC02_009696 [Tulasnella sp. 418]